MNKEIRMTSKYVPVVLVIALTVALAAPARADKLDTNGREIVVGIVAATAAVAVLITVLALHYSKKRAVTGCVESAGTGMTLTDDNHHVYLLSGNTLGIKPGDRMKLHGRPIKSKGPDKTVVWEAAEVTKDFGVCHP
jgi:hypothetical protein